MYINAFSKHIFVSRRVQCCYDDDDDTLFLFCIEVLRSEHQEASSAKSDRSHSSFILFPKRKGKTGVRYRKPI